MGENSLFNTFLFTIMGMRSGALSDFALGDLYSTDCD